MYQATFSQTCTPLTSVKGGSIVSVDVNSVPSSVNLKRNKNISLKFKNLTQKSCLQIMFKN